jgi:hypothetical protein
VPPAPVQVRVNLVVAVKPEVLCVPLIDSLPVHPPEAVQAVASVEDQVKVDVPPFFTVLGLAVNVTAGAGVVTDIEVDCTELPPLPLQVKV